MSRRPPANDDTEKGFLRRWSQRKRGEEDDATEPVAPEITTDVRPVEPQAEGGEVQVDEEPVKTDEDMPDLDTIDETTDMKDFFSPGVSEQLRNQAMRRLFHLAKFNVTDGLDDYCEDFRNFQPLGDIVTADMRYRMEVEKQRLARAANESADEQAVPAPEEGVDVPAEDEEPGPGPEPSEVADADESRADGSRAEEGPDDDIDEEPKDQT